jgi:hypothetical protein
MNKKEYLEKLIDVVEGYCRENNINLENGDTNQVTLEIVKFTQTIDDILFNGCKDTNKRG